MAASTTRLSITCFRGYPETSCEKRSRSSKTSVAFTASPTTRPACFGHTGKFCNIYARLARRSAKQEKRGKILAHTSISGVTSEQTTLHPERTRWYHACLHKAGEPEETGFDSTRDTILMGATGPGPLDISTMSVPERTSAVA